MTAPTISEISPLTIQTLDEYNLRELRAYPEVTFPPFSKGSEVGF
jgi:hypothetical protein